MEKNDTAQGKSTQTDAEKVTEFQKIGMLRTSAFNFLRDATLILKEDHPLIPRSRCFGSNGIDLSGGSMTDSAGRMTWQLTNFVCRDDVNVPPEGFEIEFPVSFVATPITDQPAHITVKYTPIQTIAPLNDIFIEVYSWNKLGEPAPFLPFYWRCRIPLTAHF